jgi:hypothetical protein
MCSDYIADRKPLLAFGAWLLAKKACARMITAFWGEQSKWPLVDDGVGYGYEISQGGAMSQNDVLALEANFKQWRDSRTLGLKKDINPFEYYCADQFLKPFGLSDDDLLGGLVGGHQDGGIDALYFFVNRKLVDEAIDLDPKSAMQVHLVVMQVKEGDGFSPTAIQKLYFFTDDLLDLTRAESSYQTTYRPKLLELMRLFKDKYQAVIGSFPEVLVDYYYVTKLDVEPNEDCNKAADRVKEKVSQHIGAAKRNLHFINAPRLWTQVQIRPKRSQPLQWAAQPMETPEGFVGLVRLKDYYTFLRDENGELLERIFESNVRGFWPHSPINARIKDTLEKPGLADFWLLNNGITVLAAKTTPAGFTRLEIDDPQIVNGLQTSRQVYNYYHAGIVPADDNRRILVKVIQTGDKTVRDDVIRATNSQNKMPDEALRITDAIHRQIESLFLQYGLHYDRRKGQYRMKGNPSRQS